jgi:hypothetical protein
MYVLVLAAGRRAIARSDANPLQWLIVLHQQYCR